MADLDQLWICLTCGTKTPLGNMRFLAHQKESIGCPKCGSGDTSRADGKAEVAVLPQDPPSMNKRH